MCSLTHCLFVIHNLWLIKSLTLSLFPFKERLNEAPPTADYRSPYDEEDLDINRPRVYPYSALRTTNYKLPRGADKTKLETYLSEEEFENVFSMTRDEFYKLPTWKQQSRKKAVLLF